MTPPELVEPTGEDSAAFRLSVSARLLDADADRFRDDAFWEREVNQHVATTVGAEHREAVGPALAVPEPRLIGAVIIQSVQVHGHEHMPVAFGVFEDHADRGLADGRRSRDGPHRRRRDRLLCDEVGQLALLLKLLLGIVSRRDEVIHLLLGSRAEQRRSRSAPLGTTGV